MPEITILTKEKQLSRKLLSPKKAFKIIDNHSVVLFSFSPFISDNVVHIVSVQIRHRTENRILINVFVFYQKKEREQEKQFFVKKAFLLFNDPIKYGKLIARKAPFDSDFVQDVKVRRNFYRW